MAKTKNDADKKTLELIEEVKKRKAEIAQAERPNWATNCFFSEVSDKGSGVINIHVCADVRVLVGMAAYLRQKELAYKEAAETLGVDAPPFTWNGYSVADWVSDIKTRINKIQIADKKAKLEKLEGRLNTIISPELKRELELQSIMDELQ